MMEKAIKQRLLGGLVLVAGAALFLPVLLDGSGASLTIPPMPAPPEVGGVEAVAPRLDQKVATADQSVDAAHAGRDAATPADAGPVGAGEGEVAPDAAALAAAGESRPVAAAPATAAAVVAPAVAAPRPAPAAPAPAPGVAGPTPAPLAVPKPADPRAVEAKPAPAKPVAVAPAPKPVAAAPAPAPAKPASTGPAGGNAWVVQVAVLSSRDKAQALVQQLRRKGYPAVMTPYGGNFKVQVGPELDRAVADSIKSRLAGDPELRLSGWVQPYRP